MASTIMHEVWKHAAAHGLTPTDMLVLLRLADSAGEDDRMGWEAAATIAERTGSAERSVFRSLAALEKKGIISTPAKEEWPQAALRYRSVVRHILPVEDWPAVAEEPSEDATAAPVVDVIPTAKLGSCYDNMAVTLPNLAPNSKLITTSSLVSNSDTSYLSAGQVRPRVASGWESIPSGKPKRPTKRQRDEAARAAEVASDPFEADLDRDPDSAPTDTGSGDPLAEGRQEVAARRSTRPVGPSENLARYFETLASPQVAEEPAGRFSRKALAKNITTWRKQGTTDAQIRQMIETYWGPAFRRNFASPAWKDFINQRGQIHGQTQKTSTVVAWEANRLNEDFWT